MDEGNKLNFTGRETTGQQNSSPSVPPPPPEVKVRTMRSDLEAMAKSGGAMPTFESVKAPGLVRLPEKKENPNQEKVSSVWILIVASIAISLALVLGYFIYKFLAANNGSSAGSTPIETQPTTPQDQTATPPAVSSTSAPDNFKHESLFKKPADKVVSIVVPGTAGNAADLQTFSQRLNLALSSRVYAAANLFEINMKSYDGRDLTAGEIFSLADSAVIDEQFLEKHFNSDATFFVLKDKSGFWPGYVLALKTGESWLFLKDEVAKLEQSPKIINFFLADPGAPSIFGFKDDTIGGQGARVLSFSQIGASFIYSWVRGNLIFATSVDGFKQALARL